MPKSLIGCYQDILNAFNGVKGIAPDYDALTNSMDQNVIVLKKVMYPESLTGPTAIDYLVNDMQKRNCRFKNVTRSAYPKNERNATYGNVSGQGDYYDDQYTQGGKRLKIHVTFSWCFSRPTPTDEWRLVNVFGAQIADPSPNSKGKVKGKGKRKRKR
jgi:hypothetical protein